MSKKVYTIAEILRDGRKLTFVGTLEELQQIFSYPLIVGNSRDATIPLKPKTASALVKAVNKSALVSGRYYDYYTLVK